MTASVPNGTNTNSEESRAPRRTTPHHVRKLSKNERKGTWIRPVSRIGSEDSLVQIAFTGGQVALALIVLSRGAQPYEQRTPLGPVGCMPQRSCARSIDERLRRRDRRSN